MINSSAQQTILPPHLFPAFDNSAHAGFHRRPMTKWNIPKGYEQKPDNDDQNESTKASSSCLALPSAGFRKNQSHPVWMSSTQSF